MHRLFLYDWITNGHTDRFGEFREQIERIKETRGGYIHISELEEREEGRSKKSAVRSSVFVRVVSASVPGRGLLGKKAAGITVRLTDGTEADLFDSRKLRKYATGIAGSGSFASPSAEILDELDRHAMAPRSSDPSCSYRYEAVFYSEHSRSDMGVLKGIVEKETNRREAIRTRIGSIKEKIEEKREESGAGGIGGMFRNLFGK